LFMYECRIQVYTVSLLYMKNKRLPSDKLEIKQESMLL